MARSRHGAVFPYRAKEVLCIVRRCASLISGIKSAALDVEIRLHLTDRRGTGQLGYCQPQYWRRRLVRLDLADHQLLASLLDETGSTKRRTKLECEGFNELDARMATSRCERFPQHRQGMPRIVSPRIIWDRILEVREGIRGMEEEREGGRMDSLMPLTGTVTKISLQLSD
jgi:hypothetical protein